MRLALAVIAAALAAVPLAAQWTNPPASTVPTNRDGSPNFITPAANGLFSRAILVSISKSFGMG